MSAMISFIEKSIFELSSSYYLADWNKIFINVHVIQNKEGFMYFKRNISWYTYHIHVIKYW